MELSIEEQVIIEAVKIYIDNSYENFIDLSRINYDTDKLLEAINSACCAGMISKMISGDKILKAPAKLRNFVDKELETYKMYYDRAEEACLAIGRHCYNKGIKCVFAGNYLTMKEYLSRGDIFVEELTVYISRDTDFGCLPKGIKVVKIIKNEEFFERHYYEFVKFNRVNIKTLYKTAENEFAKNPVFGVSLLNLYILYCYMAEQVNNFEIVCKTRFKQLVNEIFGKRYQVSSYYD